MRFAMSVILFCLTLPALGATGDAAGSRFELRPGDRIVFLGSGLIEQERRYGFLEMRLSRRLPEGSLVFRNLGWAGDTVRGIARTDGFQNPAGFARLLKEVQDWNPTVLFIGYGTNESFDGPAGLAGFRTDYANLLAKLAPLKARVVLLSPLYQEDLGRPFPDPAAHNRDVDKYVIAIHRLAEEHKLPFVNLTWSLTASQRAAPDKKLTTNGLQLNEAGSALVAEVIERELGLPMRPWRVQLDAVGKVLKAVGAKLDKIAAMKNGIAFQALDQFLPACGEGQHLQVLGLPSGDYSLKIDGQRILTCSAADWQRGISFVDDALAVHAEKLRKAIIINNELFYRRWRPFNDHSRHWGFIGGDFQLYDREIEAQEKIIAQLRRPVAHRYELVRIGDSK
jgi:lysophospholipase L1-like esterase